MTFELRGLHFYVATLKRITHGPLDIFFIFDGMVLLNTFLSKTIKNNYIFSSKNANYATLEDKLNVFLSESVNIGLPNICLLFFFFHIYSILYLGEWSLGNFQPSSWILGVFESSNGKVRW
jgi:hypothetical protein